MVRNATVTRSRTNVLIVGAGPVGLTLATELMRHGVSCRIVDKMPQRPITESRAIGIHSRTLEIFERLGVLKVMFEHGRIIHGFTLHAEGRRLGRLTFDGLDAPYPFVLILPQAETERILIERLEKLGVTVERPMELIALQQDTQTVHGTLRDVDGNEEEVTASYLVACDGGKSAARKLLGLRFDGIKMEGSYLIDCQIDWEAGEEPNEDDGNLYLSLRTMMIIGRLPSGLWRVAVTMQQDDPRMKPEKPTLEMMQTIMSEHLGTRAHLHDLTWSSTFYVSNRKVNQLRHERIFFAGDAAHIHSPAGGQGMNTGVQDAFNLAWKLALHLSGVGNAALLNSYHAERYPVIEKLLPTIEAAERAINVTQPLAAKLRNELVSFITGFGFMQSLGGHALSGMMVNYRNSPIVAEHKQPLWERLQTVWSSTLHPGIRECLEFDRGPAAGDRAPDAKGVVTENRQPKRLFELWLGETRHQLLIFTGLSAQPKRIEELNQIVEQIKTQHGSLIRPYLVKTRHSRNSDISKVALLDLTGELHRRYTAKFECLYLVRPDGYISFRSQPVSQESLLRYLGNVFAPNP